MLDWKSYGGLEGRKPVIHSRKSAVCCCLVHIIPLFVSGVLLYFNLKRRFIGSELEGQQNKDSLKLSVLQVCAKAQELAIVASTTTILLELIRYELMYGNGLPLGLLASAFSYSQVRHMVTAACSWFITPDFWGSLVVCGKPDTGWGKFRSIGLIVLLVVCGFIAVLAGPAAAILMLPTVVDWPVGGVIYWINGTNEQLWPQRLTADSLLGYGCDNQNAQLYDPRCPSAGFPSLYQHFSNWRGSPITDSWAWTSHGPTASTLNVAADLHNHYQEQLLADGKLPSPLTKNIAWASSKSFTVSSKVPAVRVKCTPGITGFTLGQPLSIPFVSQPEYYYINSRENNLTMSYFNVTEAVASKFEDVARVHDLTTLSVLDIFAQPFVLPQNFGSNSIGLIVLTLDDARNLSGNARACSIDARWVNGTSSILDKKMSSKYSYGADQGSAVVNAMIAKGKEFGSGLGFIHPKDDGTWQSIKIDPSWFALLAPQVSASILTDPLHQATTLPNRTTLESLLTLFRPTTDIPGILNLPGAPPPEDEPDRTTLESIIASYVADGISRTGSQINLNYASLMSPISYRNNTISDRNRKAMVRYGGPALSFDPSDALAQGNKPPMVMHTTISGYAMGLDEANDYVWVLVLLLHALLALLHAIWVWRSREGVSQAWGSITELVSLALTSTATQGQGLENTCGGIEKISTMKLVARIEAVTSRATPANQGLEQLQLRVTQGYTQLPSTTNAQKGVAYGNL
ncbi:hypothetical protein BKA56DRAFT_688086 [Ilyonectria sp. MPI-CAGE-AT-0026]|nr:hypothetical protein BKA56DRAFT_688086 [Ilyonectria sp. MPI-CAGE-AT-0026]